MDSVTLKKDGAVIPDYDESGSSPLTWLGHRITLEEGYCLADFLLMLERYPDLTKLSVFFPELLERFRETWGRELPASGLEWLEFSRTVEMIGFPGPPSLEIYNSFYGLSGGLAGELKNHAFESLLVVPIRLGGVRHIVFGDRVDIYEFKTAYTFFEFLDGLAWELSIQGAPARCALRR
ncbi:MAG: hypothetical protein V1816_12435 [Pseudomonadota bacterium]